MKKFILYFAFLLFVFDASAQAPGWEWAIGSQSSGSFSGYTNTGNGVATDSQGNVYMIGTCSDSMYFGDTFVPEGGMFLVKSDASGNILWVQHADSAEGIDLVIDANDFVYVTGFFEGITVFGNTTFTSNGSDIFIAKYDNAGNLVWARQEGGNAHDYVNRIFLDPHENIFITGNFEDVSSIGGNNIGTPGMFSAFFARYDTSGTLSLVETAISSGLNFWFTSIFVDNGDNIYLAGRFQLTASFDNFSISTVSADENDGDIFMCKYNSSGTAFWVKQAGGIGDNEFARDILIDNSGNIYIAGNCGDNAVFDSYVTSGVGNNLYSNYMFWAKYDSSANLVWIKTPDEANASWAEKMTFSPSGDLYIAFGNYSITPYVFGSDSSSNSINILRSDTSGNVIWIKDVYSGHVGGFCCVGPHSLTYNNGNLYLTGMFADSAAFDNFVLTGDGFYSSFLAKLNIECSAYFTLTQDTIPYRYIAVNMAEGTQPLMYTWDWGDGNYDYTAYPSHIYSDTGTYTICLTILDSSGCTDTYCRSESFKTDAQMIYVNVVPTGIIDNGTRANEDVLFVFPNPVSAVLNIDYNRTDINPNSIVEIVNSMGQQVYQYPVSIQQFTIDVSSLSPGIYFINVGDKETQLRSKFIKE